MQACMPTIRERKRVGEGRKVDEEAGVHRDSGRDNIDTRGKAG